MTRPPVKVRRRVSLSCRITSVSDDAATLLIVALLHVFALVGRHVPGTAARAIVMAGGGPLVRPFVAAPSTLMVVAKEHDFLRLAIGILRGCRSAGRRSVC